MSDSHTPRPERDGATPDTPEHGPEQEGSAPTEREWINVPRADGVTEGRPVKRWPALAAMAVGLGALLTAGLAAAYLPAAAILAGLLAVIAVILATIAVIRRSTPRAAWITGFVTGAVAAVIAVGLAAFSLGSVAGAAIGEGASSADEPAGDPEGPNSAAPLIEWPANMSTGAISFGAGREPVRSDPLEFGQAPDTPVVDRSDGVLDLRVYVDYRCPFCSAFEEANGSVIAELVESGQATLELVPLTFLDRVSEGSQYSSRAAAALACVVDAQPDLAWSAHEALLAPDVQPGEGGPGLTNEQLVDAIENEAGGLDPATRSCIADERFVPFAQALNEWVFLTPVPGARDAELRVTGTPFVVAGGEPYLGDPRDPEAFRAFLTDSAGV